MTNFEWLVKSGELNEFLFYLFYEFDDDVDNRYNIPWLDDTSLIGSIAVWLQAEHKEPKKKKYVAFDEVLEILRLPRYLDINTNGTIDTADKLDMVSKYFYEAQKALFNLETKEIDE